MLPVLRPCAESMGAVVGHSVSATNIWYYLVISICSAQTLFEGSYGLPSEGLDTQALQEQEYYSDLQAEAGC